MQRHFGTSGANMRSFYNAAREAGIIIAVLLLFKQIFLTSAIDTNALKVRFDPDERWPSA